MGPGLRREGEGKFVDRNRYANSFTSPHEQAMSVLLEPAIAHLGEAEHPLDEADRMFDFGPHLRLGTVFARSRSFTLPRGR